MNKSTEMDNGEEKRVRHLTHKAQDEYLANVEQYNKELSKVSRDSDNYIAIAISHNSNNEDINNAARMLQESTTKYTEISDT